jgi:alpha-D-ribose 1-methylphosphonate 5-triphosphate synthase subunit PhnG
MEPDSLTDYVLCECALDALMPFVGQLVDGQSVDLVKPPGVCLTMIRAEDSVERQEFYLGEALTTDCEVAIGGQVGYGICLGDEPDRAWCLAVIDALLARRGPEHARINAFLDAQLALVRQAAREEFGQILRTKVDFKLMEQL